MKEEKWFINEKEGKKKEEKVEEKTEKQYSKLTVAVLLLFCIGIIFFLIILAFSGCAATQKPVSRPKTPNILWIYLNDCNSCFAWEHLPHRNSYSNKLINECKACLRIHPTTYENDLIRFIQDYQPTRDELAEFEKHRIQDRIEALEYYANANRDSNIREFIEKVKEAYDLFKQYSQYSTQQDYLIRWYAFCQDNEKHTVLVALAISLDRLNYKNKHPIWHLLNYLTNAFTGK